MERTNRSGRMAVCALLSTFVVATPTFGQVDNLTQIVDRTTATGNGQSGNILTFGYDPTGAASGNDTIYVAMPTNTGGIRKVSNVGGTQSAVSLVSVSDLTTFYRGNDSGAGNRSGQQLPSGLLLNPLPVGNIPAYSQAWIEDGGTVVKDGTTPRNDLTQRIYTFDLNPVTSGTPPIPNFHSLLTKAAMATAIGLASNTTSSDGFGRQFAWSSDGQSLYSWDSNSPFGGLWKTNAATGATARLYAAGGFFCEPGVLPNPSGGDRVFVEGSGGNVGGLDVIVSNGSTTTGPTPALSVSDLKAFLQTSSTPDIRSITSDSAGDVFFYDFTTKNLLRIDSLGRIDKIVSKAQRDSYFSASTNNNMLHMQVRNVTYGSGPGAFDLPQIMYVESSPLNTIDGVYAFKAGDFNRDNLVNQSDVNLLKTEVTTRRVQKSNPADLKYDMNGDGAVDWKDIKIFQQFDPSLYSGDANMDGQVDVTDVAVLADNWQTGNHSWLEADFNGDDFVDVTDLGILATYWQAGVANPAGPGSLQEALAAYGLGDVSIPEPSAALCLPAILMIYCSRRNSRLALLR